MSGLYKAEGSSCFDSLIFTDLAIHTCKKYDCFLEEEDGRSWGSKDKKKLFLPKLTHGVTPLKKKCIYVFMVSWFRKFPRSLRKQHRKLHLQSAGKLTSSTVKDFFFFFCFMQQGFHISGIFRSGPERNFSLWKYKKDFKPKGESRGHECMKASIFSLTGTSFPNHSLLLQ